MHLSVIGWFSKGVRYSISISSLYSADDSSWVRVGQSFPPCHSSGHFQHFRKVSICPGIEDSLYKPYVPHLSSTGFLTLTPKSEDTLCNASHSRVSKFLSGAWRLVFLRGSTDSPLLPLLCGLNTYGWKVQDAGGNIVGFFGKDRSGNSISENYRLSGFACRLHFGSVVHRHWTW